MPHAHPFHVVKYGDVLRVHGLRGAFNRQRVVTLSGYSADYELAEPGPDASDYVKERYADQQRFPYGQKLWQGHEQDEDFGRALTYADKEAQNGKSGAVWLSAQSIVVAAREYHAAMAAEQAKDIDVNVGDLVVVASSHPHEVGLFRIAAPGRMDGDSCQLVRVQPEEVEPQPVEVEQPA